MEMQLIAHSPYFGGQATEPYRVVVMYWPTKEEFVVNRQNQRGELVGSGRYTHCHEQAIDWWWHEIAEKMGNHEPLLPVSA